MKSPCIMLGAALAAGVCLNAQTHFYGGTDITGRLTRTAVTQLSGTNTASLRPMARLLAIQPKAKVKETLPKIVSPQPRQLRMMRASFSTLAPMARSLTVSGQSSAFNVLGLTHYDQRNANNGNQFSVEPPSPDIAASNAWVLEGVNNAIQVYDVSGAPRLPKVFSTNELFAVPPAVDWTRNIYGVYPTDMRVFYDYDIDRWFVLQRAQDYDPYTDNPLDSSHLYLAVSQTGDPTGSYNIYTMDTTNTGRPGCPCFSDFPQIGADKYGVYISSDEYTTWSGTFTDVSILAISKAGLKAGAQSPTAVEFVVYRTTGYEATVRPAMTPPGSSYVMSYGGAEFFLSTNSYYSSDTSFGLWAMTNTASLNTTPNLTLMYNVVPGIQYVYPGMAQQKGGVLTYGSTLSPPGVLAYLDGGRDARMLSLVYSSGRLFGAFATQATDETGLSVVAGGYAVLYPYIRGSVIGATLAKSGYLAVNGNNVLRPSVAVNAQGKGAIAFTLVGPQYYPSAAFVPVDAFTVGSAAQIAAAGVEPEDGFTGYPDLGFTAVGTSRWGDYSGAVTAPDGSIWMTVEYIPGTQRTQLANWGTRIVRYVP